MVSPSDAGKRFLASTEEALSLLDGLTREQWSHRPDGEEWSLAETVEHVVLTNEATLGLLGRPLFSMPRPESMFRGPAPPGLAEPKGRYESSQRGIEALTATRDAIVERVIAEEGRLRDFALPHPVFGPFDGVQWVLFVAAHTDNHIPQLRRLRETLSTR